MIIQIFVSPLCCNAPCPALGLGFGLVQKHKKSFWDHYDMIKSTNLFVKKLAISIDIKYRTLYKNKWMKEMKDKMKIS